MTPQEIQQVTEIVDQVVSRRMGGSGRLGTTGGTTSGGQDNAGMLTRGADNVINSLGKLTVGIYNTSDALNDFDKLASIFPGVGDVIGQFGKGVGAYAFQINSSMIESTRSGFSFNQNMGLYVEAVRASRMSLDDWTKFVKESGPAVAALGSNANEGALNFLATAKQLQEDPSVTKALIGGIGTVEDFNTALKVQMNLRKFADMNDERVRRDTADAAKEMVFQMNEVSRLTGKSKEQLQKEIQEEQEKAQTKLRVAAMSEEERKAYDANTKMLSRYPQEVQAALTAFTTGGPRSAKDRENITAIGPEITRLVAEMSKIKGDTPEDQRRRVVLNQSIEQEILRISTSKRELEMRSALAGTDAAQAKAIGETSAKFLDYAATIKKEDDAAQRAGITREQYRAAEAEKERARISKIGEKDPSKMTPEEKAALPAQLMNTAINKLESMGAGTAVGFGALNTKVGEAASRFDKINEAMKPLTTEQFKNFPDALEQWARKMGWTGVNVNYTNPNSPNSPTPEVVDRIRNRRAGGGDVSAGETYLVGEAGQELFTAPANGKITSASETYSLLNALSSTGPQILANMQSELKSKMTESRAGAPTADMFTQLFDKFKEIPKTISTGNQFASTETSSKSFEEVGKQLNMRLDKLIAAVEENTSKSVKATKFAGNQVA